MTKIPWQEEMPSEVRQVFAEHAKSSSGELYGALKTRTTPLTSIQKIRALAERYSKRYGLPIRVSAKGTEEVAPNADAGFTYWYDKAGKVHGIMYLHPVLRFYPESYVRGVIEHELDHYNVERKWEDIL